MATYSAPTSYNLAAFAGGLVSPTGQKVFQVLGDSINNAASTNSLYPSNLALPFQWNGFFQVMFNSVLLGYANHNSSNIGLSEYITPGGTAGTRSGSSSFWPTTWHEGTWTANPAGNYYGDQFAWFKAPSTNIPIIERMAPQLTLPFLRDDTYNVTARGLVYTIARSIAADLTPGSQRVGTDTGSISSVASGSAVVKSGSPPAYQYGEASCGSGAVDANANSWYDNSFPGFRWSTAAGAISAGVTDCLIQLGTRFLNNNPNGVLYNAPFSVGGWTLGDHVNTTKVTDAALSAYYSNVGVPTHMWVHLGQNPVAGDYTNLDGGSLSSFKTNVNAVIDRHDAIITALGQPAPRWCLVSQYATSPGGVANSFAFHDNMAKAHLEIALARGGRFSTLNLFRLMNGTSLGGRTAGKGQNFVWASISGSADDFVHPAAWAGEMFVQAEAREIMQAMIRDGMTSSTERAYDKRFRG